MVLISNNQCVILFNHSFDSLKNIQWQYIAKYDIKEISSFMNNTVIQGNHSKDEEYVLPAGSPPFSSAVYYIRSSLMRANSTYAIINNVYVQPAGAFGTDSFMYQYPNLEHDDLLHILALGGRVIGNYSDVISINNRWCDVFAHFLFDAVAPLAFVPIDVLKTAKIILLQPSVMYFQILESIGISNDQIIPMRTNEFIYAQRIHTILNPEPIHGSMIYGLGWLRKTISNKFQLDKIQPIYFGLYNRPKGSNRHILKFKSFIKECKKKYKNVYVLPYLHKSLQKCVSCYASIKILFGPTGSNLANMIYMKEECGVVAALGDLKDLPMEACAEVLHMWMITFTVDKMGHHSKRKAPLNHTRAFIAIDYVMYAVEYKKWKSKDIKLFNESINNIPKKSN